MELKRRDLWTVGFAFLFALTLHLASLPGVGGWVLGMFAPQEAEPPLEMELSEALPKPRQSRLPSPKEKEAPLPDQEKNLTDAPDRINPNARSSSPAGGAEEEGIRRSLSRQKGMAEVKEQMKEKGPQSTGEDGLDYMINNYQWNHKRFMENWAVALSKRWLAPADYLQGQVPAGGSVWVKITLKKDGTLESYEVMEHNVSEDMALMVVYAVMGVRSRPPLPESFPEEKLVAYWRFVYPPFEQLKAMIEAAKGKGQ